jgi:hypothetical protein
MGLPHARVPRVRRFAMFLQQKIQIPAAQRRLTTRQVPNLGYDAFIKTFRRSMRSSQPDFHGMNNSSAESLILSLCALYWDSMVAAQRPSAS